MLYGKMELGMFVERENFATERIVLIFGATHYFLTSCDTFLLEKGK